MQEVGCSQQSSCFSFSAAQQSNSRESRMKLLTLHLLQSVFNFSSIGHLYHDRCRTQRQPASDVDCTSATALSPRILQERPPTLGATTMTLVGGHRRHTLPIAAIMMISATLTDPYCQTPRLASPPTPLRVRHDRGRRRPRSTPGHGCLIFPRWGGARLQLHSAPPALKTVTAAPPQGGMWRPQWLWRPRGRLLFRRLV